ncbi:Metallothionein expression activator [Blyttiomyces sp. JEL0837]|nr:Metallothionein expression activator [Blyttiomyces sp. JEL0837]
MDTGDANMGYTNSVGTGHDLQMYYFLDEVMPAPHSHGGAQTTTSDLGGNTTSPLGTGLELFFSTPTGMNIGSDAMDTMDMDMSTATMEFVRRGSIASVASSLADTITLCGDHLEYQQLPQQQQQQQQQQQHYLTGGMANMMLSSPLAGSMHGIGNVDNEELIHQFPLAADVSAFFSSSNVSTSTNNNTTTTTNNNIATIDNNTSTDASTSGLVLESHHSPQFQRRRHFSVPTLPESAAAAAKAAVAAAMMINGNNVSSSSLSLSPGTGLEDNIHINTNFEDFDFDFDMTAAHIQLAREFCGANGSAGLAGFPIIEENDLFVVNAVPLASVSAPPSSTPTPTLTPISTLPTTLPGTPTATTTNTNTTSLIFVDETHVAAAIPLSSSSETSSECSSPSSPFEPRSSSPTSPSPSPIAISMPMSTASIGNTNITSDLPPKRRPGRPRSRSNNLVQISSSSSSSSTSSNNGIITSSISTTSSTPYTPPMNMTMGQTTPPVTPLTKSPTVSVLPAATTSDREFGCGTCGKAFQRRQDLRRHEMIHTGIKAFTCPLGCGTLFSRHDALQRHLKAKRCQ